MKFLKKRKVITRMGDNGREEPYLIRWNLFECDWFSIKIHRILVSDDDCMHDHPWNFVSFILKGGYVEESPRIPYYVFSKDLSAFVRNAETKKVLYGAGSILYRKARHIHRLDVFQPATTLVISFRKIRQWGFFTSQGFIHWFNYQKQNHCQ